ncbi:MAG: hypothetical protein HYV28_07710 [Ignavibacteriales bacterium]|nr:hypothetical protein [Ignavibacteriales bacterium]
MSFKGSSGKLFLKTLSFVIFIIIIKLILHSFQIEFISITTFFSGIIAANVFLMGFLLSGVLTDYKESEKIPGEMATILSAIIFDLAYFKKKAIMPGHSAISLKKAVDILDLLFNWFDKKFKTQALLEKLDELNEHVNDLEPAIQVNHVIRLKNEITNLKRIIIRTDTIRDTDFISSGYMIASISTTLLCIALIFAKPDPFYETFFFISLISFLIIFLLLLIADLDNPFNYTGSRNNENVSLYPLERLMKQLSDNQIK